MHCIFLLLRPCVTLVPLGDLIQSSEHHVSRVGAWPRLGAAAVDQCFSATLALCFANQGWGWYAASKSLMEQPEWKDLDASFDAALAASGWELALPTFMGASILASTIYPWIEGLTGASPGKWLLGLRIGNENGQPGNLVLYFKRLAVKHIRLMLSVSGILTGFKFLEFVAGPAGLVMGTGTLFLLMPHRQCLHDKMVKSAVYWRRHLQGQGN